eukprot:EG_transcript_484
MKELFRLDTTANGKGPVVFAWQKDGNFLAVAGANKRVNIVDRQGKMYHQIPLPGGPAGGTCIALDWDCTGEVLAVLQAQSTTIPLWNFNSKKLELLDTGMKDMTFMKWSKTGPQLAIGTAKGNLLIYHRKTLKKIPIVGKHTKAITCGAWNSQNKLALGAEDRQLTISNAEGDTLDQAHMKHEPTLIQFSDMKADERAKSKENTVSVNMGGKTLLLYNTTDQDNPIELAFQQRYGNIVAYKWFGDGYILIGFSSGYVVIISTHLKEIGQEVNSIRFHRDNLADVTFSPSLQKGASIGDNCIKVFDMSELSKMSEQRSEKVELDNEFGTLSRLDWTEDGQILTVSSKQGYVYAFLTRIPVLHDAWGTRVLYLESLRDLRVKDIVSDEDLARIRIEIEPTFVSLGSSTAAVGMNNCVWYYRFVDQVAKLQTMRTYLSTVQYVKLSRDFVAVLTDGRVTLHPVEEGDDAAGGVLTEETAKRHRVFPEKDDTADISTLAMTEDFLIYGTSRGTIHYFSLDDWCYVNEFRFSNGIRHIFPNKLGTRVVFIDQINAAYLYNPVNDQAIAINRFSGSTEKLMWDSGDWGIFYGVDNQQLTTYVYAPNSRAGPIAEAVSHTVEGTSMVQTTDRPFGFVPILCHNGNMVCQRRENGQLATVTMQTHQYVSQLIRLNPEQMTAALHKHLALHRLDEAWKLASQLNTRECWLALAEKALHLLEITMAIRVHRRLEQPAMVMALEKLAHVNEKNLLLGHVALLSKHFSEAQSHFMRSTCPTLALDMRRDLMHWDVALKLAEQLAPGEIPVISREYAQQLEFKGEAQAALDYYSKALIDLGAEEHGEEADYARRKKLVHNKACHAGIARMTIRLGDLRRGFGLAMESEDRDLCLECAQIFEEMKQWNDAAALYERADLPDKAAMIYILETKSLSAAAKLMPRIKSPKIFVLFAKAKEKEGSFKEAKEAYDKAGDMDSVVRLNVEHLNNLAEAHLIVRRTRSTEAAGLVARHCKKTGDFKTAIEFLLLARKTAEAFEMATAHGEMATYAQALGANGTNEEYQAIAKYYDEKGDHGNAGDYFFKCGHFSKALKHYLHCGDTHLTQAIEVVGKARQDNLTNVLIDYLMGETDGVPKDPNYIFRLYMALGSFEKAAKTAVIIARQEQEMGSYRAAHRILFDTHCSLEGQKIRIPSDLKRNLMLLHSYIIVKTLVKTLNDHETSARMLIRVAKNIAKFPKHVVPILTSTVIECQRVELKASAFEYACALVQPEHRAAIDEKYRKKIESIVRKKGKEEGADPEETTTPCPFCGAACPETTLDCLNCKSTIPYCLVTGKHMVLTDWSYCPSCRFPALYSALLKVAEVDKVCLMCEKEISAAQVKKVDNPDPRAFAAPEDRPEEVAA